MAGRGISSGMALAFVAGCVVLASCGGSSSPSGGPTATASGPPPVGKSIRIRARGTTLIVTVRRVTFPLRRSGILLSPGDRAAGVDVTMRDVGHAVYDSSSESDVSVRSSKGDLAEPGFASRGSCATSEIDFLKEVQPGESRSGCVAFDVPRGTRPAAVRFSPEGRQGLGRTWVVRG